MYIDSSIGKQYQLMYPKELTEIKERNLRVNTLEPMFYFPIGMIAI